MESKSPSRQTDDVRIAFAGGHRSPSPNADDFRSHWCASNEIGGGLRVEQPPAKNDSPVPGAQIIRRWMRKPLSVLARMDRRGNLPS